MEVAKGLKITEIPVDAGQEAPDMATVIDVQQEEENKN